MKKNIIIIGGGISGLSILHALNQRFRSDKINIQLLEKSSRMGGTIQTVRNQSNIFETGPNGFLNNNPSTLRLIEELHLSGLLIQADESSKRRYVFFNDRLHQFPTKPQELLKFKALSMRAKLKIFLEFFSKSSVSESDSIYDLFERHFGQEVAEYIIDPVFSGIYAGDIRKLNAVATLKKVVKLERQYGSIIKGFIRSKKKTQLKPL